LLLAERGRWEGDPVRQSRPDPVFGSLTWDDRLPTQWKGELEWSPGLPVQVLIGLGEDRSAGLCVAGESLAWVRAHETQVRQLVAVDQLAWCNEYWGPAEPVSEAKLLQNIRLHQLWLEEDGSLWVLYRDGQLFGGHVFCGEFGADKEFLCPWLD
jgi:hypothetical protein